METLKEKFEAKFVEYFFDEKCNILWNKMKPAELQNNVNRLNRILKELEKSRDTDQCKVVWTKYFTSNNNSNGIVKPK